ncbi:hypothetical protein [Aeromicrobium sp. Leaf350]|uniref:hypothetical protein n=1 Tax=Aeromicrobium sp. Leaf350 TaxID=2876565 RepID=UPI001E3F01A5|nr:hypothetical protein [Aeromicrobium sp. Leaf350]
MEIAGEDVRDRLRRLGPDGRITHQSVWAPYLVATSGAAAPLAEMAERQELPEGGSAVVYTGLLPKRLVRVVARGRGEWEDPFGAGPSSVEVTSSSIEAAAYRLENLDTLRSEVVGSFTVRSDLVIEAGDEAVPVPYFRAPRRGAPDDDVDAFVMAVLAELNR